jgi:hypothetical protein
MAKTTRVRAYISALCKPCSTPCMARSISSSAIIRRWFMDGEEIEDAIRGRAAIHLFGHKHRQRIYKDDAYVRFSAGAVNPDRYDLDWRPGYNFILLSVAQENGARHLDVEAHLLEWQNAPPMFRPILATQGETVFRHRLPIFGTLAAPLWPALSPEPAGAEVATGAVPTPHLVAVDVEALMSDARTRNLVFRFWKLAASQRREIALRLGLIDEADMRLPEAERYGRALVRAGELGLLERVAQEVAQIERR